MDKQNNSGQVKHKMEEVVTYKAIISLMMRELKKLNNTK